MDSFWVALETELDSIVSAGRGDAAHTVDHVPHGTQRSPERMTPLLEAAEALERFKSKNQKRRRGKRK